MNIFLSLVKHFGTQASTAHALEVNQGTVSGWVRGKYGMGPIIAMKAEKLTSGKFKAIDLCPSLNRVSDAVKPETPETADLFEFAEKGMGELNP